MQVRSVSGAIALDCRGNVKVPKLFAIRITNEVSKTAVVHPLRAIFRIPDEFVDKIAKMQHEAEAVFARSAEGDKSPHATSRVTVPGVQHHNLSRPGEAARQGFDS